MTSRNRATPAPLRYAVVGTGMMGIEHIYALGAIPGCEVVALCDPHEASRSRARAAVSRPVAEFDSVGELAAHGGFDVAVVAS
ncbi:MAG: Gfo/Idh/MocA family oxidoreductase, partial [Ilumatobacteraceae bacterium]